MTTLKRRLGPSALTEWVTAEVLELPACYFCSQPAVVDAEVNLPGRPWAFMCGGCWPVHGLGVLGTGRGQRLVLATPSPAYPSAGPVTADAAAITGSGSDHAEPATEDDTPDTRTGLAGFLARIERAAGLLTGRRS